MRLVCKQEYAMAVLMDGKFDKINELVRRKQVREGNSFVHFQKQSDVSTNSPAIASGLLEIRGARKRNDVSPGGST